MGYYLKIRLKRKFDGRKIWYMNRTYLCDCVNATFENKEDCEYYIKNILNDKYGWRNLHWAGIESITMHRTNKKRRA